MRDANTTKPKIVFEWVLIMSNGDPVILTEGQYKFYKKNSLEKKVFLGDLEVNPAFVSHSSKRPAHVVKNMYPCKRCHQSGRDPEDRSMWCRECGGSGTDLPKKINEKT